jgi:hypothetical protein
VTALGQDTQERAGGHSRGEEEPVDHRPYLCIPYWISPLEPGDPPDDGERRPLPSNVVSWLCDGIHASPYSPGERLEVSVDVLNSGPGSTTALATVLVYWVDATVGFSKPNFFGADTVAVPPRGGRGSTGTIAGVIPATASNHICLLCVVTHPLDKPGKVADPVGDRHWAQHNLIAAEVAPQQNLIVPVTAVNPFPRPSSFRLLVRMLEFDLLRQLARGMGVEPAELEMRLRLLDEWGRTVGEGGRPELSLELDEGGRRLFNVSLEPFDELGGERLSAVEAVLFAEEREHPVGSLGFVLRGPRG